METRFFGILNVTPDSFSSDGVLEPEKALKKVEAMLREGLDILDIGAEGTGVASKVISASEEMERLKKVLPIIFKTFPDLTVSIDTRNYETAKYALNCGARIINDVSGLADDRTVFLLKEFNAKGVFMHSLAVPHSFSILMKEESEDMLRAIELWAKNKMTHFEKFGISRENLIFDAGIGFGKTREQSAFLLQNTMYFKSLNVPILVGHSRKSFLQAVFPERYKDSPPPIFERDLMTTIFSALLYNKVDFLRIHNPDMIKILKRFRAQQ